MAWATNPDSGENTYFRRLCRISSVRNLGREPLWKGGGKKQGWKDEGKIAKRRGRKLWASDGLARSFEGGELGAGKR